MRAYDEILDVIAGGPAAERIVNFRPSPQTQRQLEDLLERERAGSLTAAEAAELERYLQLEHLMRLAKARARLFLERQSAPAVHE